MQQVSDSELELMKIIWDNGNEALYNYISETLANQGKTWQKNTIITLLSRLVDKGLLKANKIGNRNKYIAIIKEVDYQAAQTQNLVNKLYDGSTKGLINTLVQKDMLSQEDYEDLKKFWNGGKTHD